MGRQTKSNLPQDVPLRWNVEKAASELGTSIMTLRKALARSSAEPDMDGLYRTNQITAAFFGALHEEKIKTQKELAKKYELANRVAEASLLDRAELMQGLAAIADSMTSIIQNSGLSRADKKDLQRQLAGLPLVLQETADKQTRLRRGGNGARAVKED